MLSILFLHYLISYRAVALPMLELGNWEHLDVAPVASSTCADLAQCRTIWNIVWSCLTTIFACTWLAIHPNIPAPDERPFRVHLRRMRLMVLGLLGPEIIIFWAVRQWYIARVLETKYKKYKWTQTHGFFAIMGGFVLEHGGKEKRELLLLDLEEYLSKGAISITKEEVEDRSKGDILSKGIILVQTGWFILQLLARAIQRLPVTELEIVTLGFAILNFVTYGLWWNKPLDVRCPLVIREPEKVTVAIPTVGRRVEGELHAPGNATSRSDEPVAVGKDQRAGAVTQPRGTDPDHDPPSHPPALARNLSVLSWIRSWYDALNDAGRIVLGSSLHRGVHLSEYYEVAQRVPTFHWGHSLTPADIKWYLSLYVTICLIATIFGAVHCLAWSFEMPSQAEKMLWQISATVTAAAPLEWIAGMLFGRVADRKHWNILQICSTFLAYGLFIIYLIARCILLVEAFVLLRALPHRAYETVHWTTFIPHI